MPEYATVELTPDFIDSLLSPDFRDSDRRRFARALRLLNANEQNPPPAGRPASSTAVASNLEPGLVDALNCYPQGGARS